MIWNIILRSSKGKCFHKLCFYLESLHFFVSANADEAEVVWTLANEVYAIATNTNIVSVRSGNLVQLFLASVDDADVLFFSGQYEGEVVRVEAWELLQAVRLAETAEQLRFLSGSHVH